MHVQVYVRDPPRISLFRKLSLGPFTIWTRTRTLVILSNVAHYFDMNCDRTLPSLRNNILFDHHDVQPRPYSSQNSEHHDIGGGSDKELSCRSIKSMMWSSSKISFPRPKSLGYVRVSYGGSYKNKTKLVAINTEKEGRNKTYTCTPTHGEK